MARPRLLNKWTAATAGLLATASSALTVLPGARAEDAPQPQQSIEHVAPAPAAATVDSGTSLAFANSTSRTTPAATPTNPDSENEAAATEEAEADQQRAPYYEFHFNAENTDEDFDLLEATGLTERGPRDPRLQGATVVVTFLRADEDRANHNRYQLGVTSIGLNSMREGTQRPIAHYIVNLAAEPDSGKSADMILFKQFHDLKQNNHLSLPETDELGARLPYTRVYTGLSDENGQLQFYDYSVTERFADDPDVRNGSALTIQERRRNAERIIAEINTHADQVRARENMLANAERAPYYEFHFNAENTDEDFNLLEATGLTERGPRDPRLQGATVVVTFVTGGEDPNGHDRYQLGVTNIGINSMREGTQRPIAHYIVNLAPDPDNNTTFDMTLFKQLDDLAKNNELNLPEDSEYQLRIPYTYIATGSTDEHKQRPFFDYSVMERFENDPNEQANNGLSLKERRRNAERIVGEINEYADQVRARENMKNLRQGQ